MSNMCNVYMRCWFFIRLRGSASTIPEYTKIRLSGHFLHFYSFLLFLSSISRSRASPNSQVGVPFGALNCVWVQVHGLLCSRRAHRALFADKTFAMDMQRCDVVQGAEQEVEEVEEVGFLHRRGTNTIM